MMKQMFVLGMVGVTLMASLVVVPAASAGGPCMYEDFDNRLDRNGPTVVAACSQDKTTCMVSASGAYVHCDNELGYDDIVG